jgi:hypothetical protein
MDGYNHKNTLLMLGNPDFLWFFVLIFHDNVRRFYMNPGVWPVNYQSNGAG